MRANYIKCYPETQQNNKHVKSIVNLRHVSHCIGAHHFAYQQGYTAVNTRREPVDGPFSSPPAFDILYILHYVTR